MVGRAMGSGLIEVSAVDIREHSANKHRKVDDYTYGGGDGMLMMAQPIYSAWLSAVAAARKAGGARPWTVCLSPRGSAFCQAKAREYAGRPHIILVCGHYEGIDERVYEEISDEEVSIGDYILTGGELPAMVVVDATARLLPGVLSCEGSAVDESFEGGLLEYPQYTRPRSFLGRAVPEVLLSGDDRRIREWRRAKSVEVTGKARPDLLGGG
ncbi:MAG: tRNA (guanosine(37)-N1)-methyltransferase TrmD [Oscillospiraceae bacterium]|nr:tRNA (guanosine(37)-N1)-methyltransferase TrmD [Oscillospiraceae bacterium]